MKENKALWSSIFIIGILLSVAIWVIILLIPQEFVLSKDERSASIEFNDGWEVYVGHNLIGNAGAKSFVNAESKDELSLKNTLPAVLTNTPTVLFRTHQQLAEVYVDGEKIYSFGDFTLKAFVQAVPSRWNIVSLPDSSEGKEIVIKLSSEYDRYSGYVPGFILGSRSQCYSYIIENDLVGLLLSSALIVIVIMLLIAILLAKKNSSGFKILVWWGLTVLLAGMWSLGTLGMMQLFFANPYVEWLLRNTAAFFIVPSLLKVIYEYFDNEKARRLTQIVFHLDLISIIVCLFIQLIGFVDLTVLLTVPIVFACFAVVVFIYGVVVTWKTDPVTVRISKTVSAVMLTAVTVLLPYMYTSNVFAVFDMLVRSMFVVISLVWTFMIIRDVITRMKKYEQMKKTVEEKQMTMMVHQIKPHFIYNALGAIRAQISEDPEKASGMLYDFSKYLRAHVDTLSVDKPISFEEELENVKNYAKIEKARFGDKINVLYEIEETSFLIPPLTVQPLVENSITHGLRKKKDGGTVTVRSYATKKSYIVEVVDNGNGFDTSRFDTEEKKELKFFDLFRRNKDEPDNKEKDEDLSSGIRNIRFRLSAMSGGTLEIKSREREGTVARIALPKQKYENNNGR